MVFQNFVTLLILSCRKKIRIRGIWRGKKEGGRGSSVSPAPF